MFLVQVPSSQAVAAATTLASYVAYPAFNSEEQALAVLAVAALGQSSAQLPHVCFSACLPQSPGAHPVHDLLAAHCCSWTDLSYCSAFELRVSPASKAMLACLTRELANTLDACAISIALHAGRRCNRS